MLFVLMITFVNAFIELFGLALFIPLLLLFLEDGFIRNHETILNLYNMLGFESEKAFTFFLLGVISVLILAKNVFFILLSRLQSKYIQKLQEEISSLTLKSYLTSNYLNLKKTNSNNIIWEINALPAHFVKFLILPLLTFINEFIIFIIVMVGLMMYDPRIILLLLVVVVPITYMFYRFAKSKIQSYQKRLSVLIPQLNALAQQSIFGFIDVLLTGTRKYYSKKFDEKLKEYSDINVNLYTFMLIPAKIIETAIITAIVLLMVFSIYSDSSKAQMMELLGVFAIAAYRLVPSFNKMTVSILNFRGYQYTLNYIGRTLEFVNKTDRSDLTKSDSDKMSIQNELTVKNLSFSYNQEKQILSNLDFSIKKGETIGIVGKSGSGKTTLMNIILGTLEGYEGEILVDGKKLRECNKEAWFKEVGYVQQNIFLMDATIQENIAFGVDAKDIDVNRLEAAIKMANLQDFVDNLPNGLDTKVGELGALVSGGQKQRIGIARALYSGAEILFFDEATSALDNETEKEITETLKDLSDSNNKLTMVVIAHRYSTLQHCDRIIVLENGVIKEITSYESLNSQS